MSDEVTRPVVVGVGHEPVDAALAFAAAEARWRGTPLRLVHVGHASDESRSDHSARDLLDGTVQRARDLAGPDVTVTGDLLHGRVVHALVEATVDAGLVVLEQEDVSAAKRLVTRSVSSGLAARARVPVAVVPGRWKPPAQTPPSGVVVGVDEPDQCRQVLRAAAQEAKGRGVGLTVLHTWGQGQPYGFVTPKPEEQEKRARDAEAAIEQELLGVADELDREEVTIVAQPAHAGDTLVAASREAELLVLGRHDPALPLGSHLGPVVRAVLREADSPVLLVDAAGTPA